MKNSPIRRIEGEKFFVLRETYMKICEYKQAAAVLLSYFEYWHNLKLANRKQAQKYNDISEMHGDRRTQYEGLLQWHTFEEMQTDLFGFFGISSLRNAVKYLRKKGFISVHKNPNPRYKFDRTYYYLLEIEQINIAIEQESLLLTEAPLDLTDSALDSIDSALDLSEQYTNTSSKESTNKFNNKQTNTRAEKSENDFFEPEVVVSPQQQVSNSRIDQKPTNQNEATNIELNVPPCNMIETSVTQHKAWYSLQRKDFKWLNELWAKYRFDWESADSVFLSDRVLASLKEGYKIVGEDMGMIYRLVENSLKWRAINADYHNKDLDYFLINQNYLSFGRKPLTPVLAKSHKQQEKDSNQARQAMIAMEEARRYM